MMAKYRICPICQGHWAPHLMQCPNDDTDLFGEKIFDDSVIAEPVTNMIKCKIV